MRTLALALCAVSASAMASFDLILVADSGQNVIHRYDGDTGVYLGKFGEGTLGAVRSVTVHQATRTALVSHSNGWSAFNVNTGEHLFYSDYTGPTHDIAIGSSGQLLMTYRNGTVGAYTEMSSALLPVSTYSNHVTTSTVGSFTAVGNGLDGRTYALNTTSGQLMGWTGTAFQSSTGVANANLAGLSGGSIAGGDLVALAPDGTARRFVIATSTINTGYAPLNSFTSAVDFEFGHAGEGWGLGMNASGTRLQRYYRNAGGTGAFMDAVGTGRTLSQVTTPAAIAVVTAPEPGTMIALGAGILALWRRRK